MNSNPTTAAQIDAWITPRYGQLKQRVMMTCYFDEDGFQDAYLALRETGTAPCDLETAFIKLYRSLLSRDFGQQMRYTHPDPLFFTMLRMEEEQPEEAAEVVIEGEQVDNLCRTMLSGEDYTLYSLRYKVGLALREIAAYTGRSTRTIMQKLNNIVARIRAYFCPVQAAIPA